ncbi:MAG: glycosyl hydrolase family 43, partial [Pedobacter sp.]
MNISTSKGLKIHLLWLGIAVSVGLSCGKTNNPTPIDPEPPVAVSTFSNPLMNGADPSVFQKDGVYY